MQNKFLFHTNKGLSIAHIGSTASKKALLFIGRSNTQKNSLPLEALMEKLALNDYLLLWPESRKKLISRQLSDKSKNIISFIDKLLGSNETIVKKYYRKSRNHTKNTKKKGEEYQNQTQSIKIQKKNFYSKL